MPLRAEYPDYGMPDHREHVPSVTLPTSGAQCSAALDTEKLKELCEAVIQDIGKEGDTPMGLDWGWANLTRKSLPALKAFLLRSG